ncbi:MAG: hypothetical protein HY955_00155 [Deltaproteobacteria bacterium]|nr:hypothetical protein [Deltaproteobacteria bacterium]
MKTCIPILLITISLLITPFAGAAEESLSLRNALPETKAEPLAWGRDPFVPEVRVSGPSTAPQQELRLKAVFYNETRPSAIINENIVYRGSLIGGQKIVDIGRTHVILQGENGSIRLELTEVPELKK